MNNTKRNFLKMFGLGVPSFVAFSASESLSKVSDEEDIKKNGPNSPGSSIVFNKPIFLENKPEENFDSRGKPRFFVQVPVDEKLCTMSIGQDGHLWVKPHNKNWQRLST